MNGTLKLILLAAKEIAIESITKVIPGSAVLISGIQKLLDKTDDNNSEAVAEIGYGLITSLENIDSTLIKDPVLLIRGVGRLRDAILDIKNSLK